MISVIVPVFNCEQYLDKCINSIINQDEKNFELILINDGSFDGTSDICTRWKEKDSRIILINQENQGQGSARNAGIKEARGEYLVFVDADDYLEPQALSLLAEYVQHKDYDIVMYQHYYISSDMEDRIECKSCIEFSTKSDIMIESTTFLWDKMFKRSFFVQNILLKNYYGEDLSASAYLIAKSDKIGLIDECLYTHLDRSGNLSSNHNRVMEIVDSLYDMFDIFERQNMLKEYYHVLLYISYKQYRLYLIDLKYRFDEDFHKKLINKFIKYFETVFCSEKNIIHILGLELTRRYIKIGDIFLPDFKQWSPWRVWRNMEHYMIDPYIIQKENEKYPLMTDYLISFTREFDSIKYGTISQELWMDRWKIQCSKFVETLKQSSFIGNIILIKQHLNNEKLDDLFNWCCGYFIERCKKAIISDEITTKIDFLKVILDSRLAYDNFDGFEKPRTISQEEKYFRGEYFRTNINLNVMNIMLKIKFSKRRFTEFFYSKNINSIAIYGMGYLGERFAEELMEEEFDIKFGIDKRNFNNALIKVINPEESFEKIDAIVVTPIHLFHEIKTSIEKKALCSIISLEEVIEYFIN